MPEKTNRWGADIPPVSEKYREENPSLLDRLRRWPAYERTEAEMAPDIRRWLSAVAHRRASGGSRRVLFVHGQLPGETGSGVYLQQIAREALQQGIDLHLLSAGYEQLDQRHIQGVPAERIFTTVFTPQGAAPEEGTVKTPVSGMSVVMPYPVLAFRDRSEADLLDWLDGFGTRMAALAQRLQPDVIHVNHLWFLNGLARLVAPWIPLVTSAHGTAFKLIMDAPRFRDLMVPCASSADHVCAISPESVQECVDTFEIPRDCITIEGYGYEPDLFYWRPVDAAGVMEKHFGIPLPAGSRLVIAVGKFVDWKGLKELTLAIGTLRENGWDVTAVIVGEGDAASRKELSSFIADHGLKRHVHLPGKVARSDLPDIYRAADVYVLPSHVEPYGMVLMEALACGAPSVAANTGGPPDFVPASLIDDGLAVLVDPIALGAGGTATPEARTAYADNLAAGIQAVLEREIDATARDRIAAAMTHLTWGRLVENLAGIYDRVSDAAARKWARRREESSS
jgi:glycosyltransferase involved in cell wall biosynthesis